MPTKDFRIWINEKTYIVVDLVMVRGQVVSFVVRLMRIENEKEINVARYDTAHGAPHRDVLGKRSGLICKEWFFSMALSKVMQDAISDFKVNYEKYIQGYEKN
jgi:hypothetical protein